MRVAHYTEDMTILDTAAVTRRVAFAKLLLKGSVNEVYGKGASYLKTLGRRGA